MILDICPGMHYIKPHLKFWVCLLLLCHLLLLLAKDVLWERCMIAPMLLQINRLPDCLPWSTLMWLDLWLSNLIYGPAISLPLLTISLIMLLLHSFTPRMQFHSISAALFPELRSLLVTSPLFILTKEGNSWIKTYNCSSHPEVSLIRPLFPILINRMVVQRDSIVPCLRKQKPCSNMPVCQSLSDKMLLKHHYISIIANQCVIIIGKHPLRYSMKTNLMFPTSEYLELVLMSLFHKSSDTTSCLLKQRR